MKAVVMAAGRGKRLAQITNDLPKVMVKVGGKPMLEHTLTKLAKAGVKEVVVIVHYRKEVIQKYFGDWFAGVTLTYVEQKEMLGTGDAVLTAEPFVNDNLFLCLAGDVLFSPELIGKVLAHKTPVITVCKVQDPSRFGVIETDNGHVKRIVEKSPHPPTNLANASVYVFPHKIFEACKKIEKSPRGEYEVTDAIQLLLREGIIFEYEVIDTWLDVGTPEQLREAQGLKCD